MKRMKLQIFVTLVMMFVVATVISGLYSVVAMKSSFITLSVIVDGILAMIAYLFYLWFHMTRYKWLAYAIIFSIVLLVLLIAFSEGVNILSVWNWKATIMIVYYNISFQIARKQVEIIRED